MNRIILFLISILPFALLGQLKIISVDNPSVALDNTEIEVAGDPTDLHVFKDLRIVNVSDEPVTVRFQRKRLLASNRLDQICDDLLCHDATDTEFFITPIDITIAPGDSSIFKPQVVPNGEEFCAIHEYNIVNSFATPYTSVVIKFTAGNQNCTLLTKKFDIDQIQVFPNPSSDYFIVALEGQNSNVTMKLTDALGKQVLTKKLNAASNKIVVSEFNNGVYFVQLNDANGELIGVKKIIIKK